MLGPVLFLIYTNDLDEDIRNFILKFADDTKVFGKVMNDKDNRKLQEDLNKLVSWAFVSPTGEHTCFAGTATVNRSPHRHSSRR